MTEITDLYRNMSSAKLEREYSPSSRLTGSYQVYIDQYILLSEQARQELPVQLDLRYGAEQPQSLDLFHPGKGICPVHIFIHGGYWQELSHKESAPMAAMLVARGSAFVALNYSLAPQASIATMIDECEQAIRWLHDNAERLQLDRDQITVSGHSAGAQLVAMTLARLQQAADSAAPRVRGASLISGIYDLTPLPLTSINEALGLDRQSALQLSPMWDQRPLEASIRIYIAEQDTDEFKRQGRDYCQHLQDLDCNAALVEVAGCNHFDIIFQPLYAW